MEWEVRIKVGMDYRLEILFVFHVQLWNFQTFVYSVDANKFVSVDEKLRPVTDHDFQLTSPHTLQVETLNPSGIDFPSFKRTVDLATLFR